MADLLRRRRRQQEPDDGRCRLHHTDHRAAGVASIPTRGPGRPRRLPVQPPDRPLPGVGGALPSQPGTRVPATTARQPSCVTRIGSSATAPPRSAPTTRARPRSASPLRPSTRGMAMPPRRSVGCCTTCSSSGTSIGSAQPATTATPARSPCWSGWACAVKVTCLRAPGPRASGPMTSCMPSCIENGPPVNSGRFDVAPNPLDAPPPSRHYTPHSRPVGRF
jgi:hypothetical protein